MHFSQDSSDIVVDRPSPSIFNNTLAQLRAEHPHATVHASTFDRFFEIAEKERHLLPIVTQEIGDTWL